MFIAINRLKVKKGRGQELVQRFEQSHGLSESPGFLSFQLLQRVWAPHGEGDHEEFLAMTQWMSQMHFQDWLKSDAFKHAHANVRADLFIAPGEPAGYEIVLEREL